MEPTYCKAIQIGRGGQPLMLHARAAEEIAGAWGAIIALADALGPKGRAAIAPILERLGAVSGGVPAHGTSASPPPMPRPSTEDERAALTREARELARIDLEIAQAHASKEKSAAERAEALGGLGW